MSKSKAVDVSGKTAAASTEETLMSCDDILIEILLCLHAKSLMRLKCVCKHWLNLISSPSFGKYHASRDTYLVSGFHFYVCHKLRHTISLKPHQSLPTLSFLYSAHPNKNFYIQDSCNGLVLCSHENWLLYSVSNPTTQKYNTIILPFSAKNGPILLSCLAFDPMRSIHYRVLIIRQEYWTDLYEIDIYFSGDKSLKRMYAQREPCGPVDHTVFWDGAVHWLNKKGSTHLQFDVDTEKLVEILLPSKAFDDFWFLYLGECGGDLLLVEGCLDYKRGYRIHEMRKGTRYWNLKQWVHIRTVEPLHPRNLDFRVVSVMKRSHLSDMELVLADIRNVFSYNTKLNKMDVLYYSFWTYSRPCSVVHYFIERLYRV